MTDCWWAAGKQIDQHIISPEHTATPREREKKRERENKKKREREYELTNRLQSSRQDPVLALRVFAVLRNEAEKRR